jgi:hypothetical protein
MRQIQQNIRACMHAFLSCIYMYVFFVVDLFFMKTCDFHGAHPRLFGKNKDESEGILCEAKPMARYGMIQCNDTNCFLCQSQRRAAAAAAAAGGGGRSRGANSSEQLNATVHFSPKQTHQFVNKYEAILNCNAVSI